MMASYIETRVMTRSLGYSGHNRAMIVSVCVSVCMCVHLCVQGDVPHPVEKRFSKASKHHIYPGKYGGNKKERLATKLN